VSGASLVLSGTGTIPARIAPNMISTNSLRLPIAIANRSPLASPSLVKVDATRSRRRSSCA
jgi:hypothetical protein